MIRIVRCCSLGCGVHVGWENDDQVVADWLLFHLACVRPNRIISIWLCPEHARKYGWKNLDLRKVKRDHGGELSEKEREVIADALEFLRQEDPEAFDLRKTTTKQTLETMREREWSISSTLIRIHE
jgi:hypothetical protein